ncbi:MAG: TrkA family potassium uptake protein [Bacteroidales bacterium]|nr:TrkA family potassium uptake protein [Bacteroidales bacterium]
MKYIIIGLGNFGSYLAEKLTLAGHEVIGVDKNMARVEAIKERITHAVCLDSSDPEAIVSLPLRNADTVVVCIGESEGSNIMVTALMKKMNVKRLISRSLGTLHENVLEAMGVDEIVRPEEEAAERWVKKLTNTGIIDSFELAQGYGVVEVSVPEKFVGRSIEEIGINKNYSIIVMTILKKTFNKNIFGASKTVLLPQGIPNANTIFESGDIMVIYGKHDDINKLLDD